MVMEGSPARRKSAGNIGRLGAWAGGCSDEKKSETSKLGKIVPVRIQVALE